MSGGNAPQASGVGPPRLAPLDADEARAAAEAMGLPAALADLNVFRVLLRHPRLARAIQHPLGLLLFRGRLDARLRELVILRLGWTTGSVYEWTQHWRVAEGLGVPEADRLAVRDWRAADRFGEAERAVLAATDEVVERGAVSPETWRRCEAVLPGVEERLELVAAIGFWRMVASLLRSLAVPLEDGVAPWPPDGRPPAGA